MIAWHDVLAATLLHFLWQGAALALLIATLFRGLRGRSPQTRYLVGLAGFLVMAVCPIVTFALSMPKSVPTASSVAVDPSDAFEPTDLHGVFPKAIVVPPTPFVAPRETWNDWIVIGWSVGVLAEGARLLLGYVGMLRWARRRMPLPPDFQAIVCRLAGAIGVRLPRVFLSARVPQALAMGLVRPVILVPAAWLTEMPLPMLEAILAHEIAHLRRYDLWINALQRLVETAFFYHPAVWWLSGCLREEREHCCDDLAIAATNDQLTYALALERVAHLAAAAAPAQWATAIGGNRMFLLQRVERVLGMTPTARPHRSWLAGVIAIAGLAIVWWSLTAANPAVADPAAPADDKEHITGTIADETGKPLADVAVEAFKYDEANESATPIGTFTSDASGQFRIPRKWRTAGDRITIVARPKERFSWHSIYRDIKQKDDPLDFSMFCRSLFHASCVVRSSTRGEGPWKARPSESTSSRINQVR